MIAPPLGYLLSVLYIKRRYGPENYALFLTDIEWRKRGEMYEFKVLPELIVLVRNEIGRALKDSDCRDGQINRVMLVLTNCSC